MSHARNLSIQHIQRIRRLRALPAVTGTSAPVDGADTFAAEGVAVVDADFASVVFLAGFESGINDEKNAATGTASGQAARSTSSPLVGTGSLLLDGNGDFVSYPDSANWLIGANEALTIECTVRFAVDPGTALVGFVTQWSGTAANCSFAFWLNNNKIAFRFRDSGGTLRDTEAAWNPAVDTTYQLAIDRTTDGTVRTYVDGVMFGKSTGQTQAFTNSTASLVLGDISGSSAWLNGRMDEVRFTKGVARYASDSGYTPTAGAFPRL